MGRDSSGECAASLSAVISHKETSKIIKKYPLPKDKKEVNSAPMIIQQSSKMMSNCHHTARMNEKVQKSAMGNKGFHGTTHGKGMTLICIHPF